MKILKCDLCNVTAKGETFEAWVQALMPHYMQAHADVMKDQKNGKEEQANWMAENKARFEGSKLMKRRFSLSTKIFWPLSIGLCVGVIGLLFYFFLFQAPLASHEEQQQITITPEDCSHDVCAGRSGLTEDQVIVGWPPQPVSGTYERPTIVYNGQTYNSSGWNHYTDLEHAFKISFNDTGFDPSFLINFYPSGSEKIDTADCVTTGADGSEEPEGLLGDGRIYRHNASSSRSYTVQETSWCQTTLKRVGWQKKSGDFLEAFSTPVKDGTVIVYVMIPGSEWVECADSSFASTYYGLQTLEECEAFNASAWTAVQKAQTYPGRILPTGMSDAGVISGGTLEQLLETFSRLES